ncbi:SR protein-specific kinase Dsk1 [Thozetella sp. PMI_491]|nr:SR protein-specific kinase Dsk1 [Thozetella sp. PMI_491]
MEPLEDGPEFPTCEEVYVHEPGVEDLEEYRPGGYHPVMIGNVYGCQYTVVHKLGFGGFSTVWLASDEKRSRYVALKILTAEESTRSREGEVLRQLHGGRGTHIGARFIAPLLDQLYLDGPNGRHLCLVGEPAGCSLSASKEEDDASSLFPMEAARSMTAQLTMGLAFLHSRGVCHGDMHLNNFLLRIPHLGSSAVRELYQRYGDPYTTLIRRIDEEDVVPHAPPRITFPICFSMPAGQVADPQVVIADYGSSFNATEERPELNSPATSLPPEDFFDEPVTPAADIWTLGVNLYELLGDRPLFDLDPSADASEILHEMSRLLGRPPQRWRDRWENRAGARLPNTASASHPIRQLVWGMRGGDTPKECEWDVEGGEPQAFAELLEGMIVYEPLQRLTAQQLLESEYMVRWAMPAWERQQRRQDARS